ncbi:glycerophosphodiester phosphodiesterase family protein [Arcticibacter tournemirensis]
MRNKRFGFLTKLKCITFVVAASLASCSTMKNTSQTDASFPALSLEAHRGGRGLMPENTIIAMINAMQIEGITTLEMDTHITKDHEVVVTHDDYLSPAFMLTPEGKEIPNSDAKKYPIYGLSYAELSKFDIGTKYYSAFPQQRKIKTHVPRLEDLIDSVQSYIKANNKKQYFYNIETKCSEKGDNVLHPEPGKFVELLMNVIEKKKITPYVVIQSFDKRTIQIIHKKYPQVKTSYLVNNKKSYEENISDLGFKPFILSPDYKMVDAGLMQKAHRDGVKIVPWTANSSEEINRLKGLKVDGIISDYPDLLVK